MSGEEARAAWHRRKGKPYGPWPEPTETSDEPTTAAIRQKEEFEQRGGPCPCGGKAEVLAKASQGLPA